MHHIHDSFEDGVLTLRLNRPEKVNAIIEPMAVELQQALAMAQQDEVRCVLLTGEGRAFCAGQDLAEVLEKRQLEDYSVEATVRGSYNPIVRAIATLPKPVVCAVNGTAAGAGANLALSCDLTLASEDAVFVQVFRNISLIPDCGGTWFLPRLIGRQRANALYLLDERLSGAQAAQIGLIHRAYPAERLMEEARAICTHLASMPTRAFGLYKKALNASMTNTLEEQLDLEAVLQAEAGSTEDCQEGINAFIEKRKPVFKGR